MQALTVATSPQLPAELAPVVDVAKQLMRQRHADATRRAYAADVLAFRGWCDLAGLSALPALPSTVALFLADQSVKGKRPSTLMRRLAAIRYLHREAGHQSPTDDESVKATLSGVRRTAGTAPRQVAPATAERVRAMLDACGDSLQGKRDRALLALGFGGAFRRSELVALNVDDLEDAEHGVRIHVRASKTDQEGAGQVVPVLDGARVRVKALLRDWLDAAGITSGPVFRQITRSGRILDRLTDRSVANIIKARAESAGMNPDQFSGHSLRAGFLTSAAASGANLFKMMEVSRHRKVDTVRGYVRQAEAFKDHAGMAFM